MTNQNNWILTALEEDHKRRMADAETYPWGMFYMHDGKPTLISAYKTEEEGLTDLAQLTPDCELVQVCGPHYIARRDEVLQMKGRA